MKHFSSCNANTVQHLWPFIKNEVTGVRFHSATLICACEIINHLILWLSHYKLLWERGINFFVLLEVVRGDPSLPA